MTPCHWLGEILAHLSSLQGLPWSGSYYFSSLIFACSLLFQATHLTISPWLSQQCWCTSSFQHRMFPLSEPLTPVWMSGIFLLVLWFSGLMYLSHEFAESSRHFTHVHLLFMHFIYNSMLKFNSGTFVCPHTPFSIDCKLFWGKNQVLSFLKALDLVQCLMQTK